MNKIVNAIVSFGAAVIIFGAWSKILHKSYADTMLTVGLLTEAAIFLLYAFMPSLSVEQKTTGLDNVNADEVGKQTERLVRNLKSINGVCENILTAIKK